MGTESCITISNIMFNGNFSDITDMNLFLTECTAHLNNHMSGAICIGAKSGSILIDFMANSDNVATTLQSVYTTYGITTSQTGSIGKFIDIRIPLEYHWNTTGIPLEYHWNTSGIPLEYH